MHARAIDKDPVPHRPSPQEDVLGDIEISAEREVLIDHFDAAIAAFVRALEMDLSPVDENFAGVALIGAGDDLHQGRLARRIVADEPQHLAGHQAQVDVDQRLHRPEALVNSLHVHDRRRHALCSKTAGVASSPAFIPPNQTPRIFFWRSQMSPTTAMIRIRPMNTFCHCCGSTNELPSRRMI